MIGRNFLELFDLLGSLRQVILRQQYCQNTGVPQQDIRLDFNHFAIGCQRFSGLVFEVIQNVAFEPPSVKVFGRLRNDLFRDGQCPVRIPARYFLSRLRNQCRRKAWLGREGSI